MHSTVPHYLHSSNYDTRGLQALLTGKSRLRHVSYKDWRSPCDRTSNLLSCVKLLLPNATLSNPSGIVMHTPSSVESICSTLAPPAAKRETDFWWHPHCLSDTEHSEHFSRGCIIHVCALATAEVALGGAESAAPYGACMTFHHCCRHTWTAHYSKGGGSATCRNGGVRVSSL